MSKKTLRKGDKGFEVKQLQNLLVLLGYNAGKADGVFGVQTENAVKHFQKKNGLIADGIVGDKTWAVLDAARFPVVKKGNQNNTVRYLQTILTDLGYNCGAIDGKFGQATYQAVVDFQKDNGLKVDGIVGKNTWMKLFSATPKQNNTKEPVYYSQLDSRWRYVMYSNHNDRTQTIGSSGCGITCSAMILATWVDSKITPLETSREAVANGFRTYNNGTAWSYFPWLAKKYGLNFEQTSSTDKAIQAIKYKNALVVASMGKGYFTNGGHYILLWDVDDAKQQIIVHDPAKKTRDRAGFNIFRQESKQYFIFTR